MWFNVAVVLHRSGLRDGYVPRRCRNACSTGFCSDGPRCVVEAACLEAERVGRSAVRRPKDPAEARGEQETVIGWISLVLLTAVLSPIGCQLVT